MNLYVEILKHVCSTTEHFRMNSVIPNDTLDAGIITPNVYMVKYFEMKES